MFAAVLTITAPTPIFSLLGPPSMTTGKTVGLRRRLSAQELMLLNCGVGEDSWGSLGLQGDPTILKELSPGCSLEGMMLKLKLQYFGNLIQRVTHWKRLWCWEGLRAWGEGDDRGWDGWMASLTQWTWVWVNSGSWWWTGRTGMLWFMGSQRVGHNWATELNWFYICKKWHWNFRRDYSESVDCFGQYKKF